MIEFINDGLMTIFFLLVGLEIKRELLVGELSSFRKAALPFIAACGGMLFPVIVYMSICPPGSAGSQGLAIPMEMCIRDSLKWCGWKTFRNMWQSCARLVRTLSFAVTIISVSYTHLDVYKRQREHGVRIIIIDYLQLMNASGMAFGSRQEEVSTISRSLKGLAKELNIPIIALSQLNRGV